MLLINAPTPGYQLQPYPPLQLGYLAAVLRETRRHEVAILDLGIEDQSDEAVLREMADFDVVGVYFVTMNWEAGLHLCKLAKQLGLITMAGGPHTGLNPEETIQHGCLDYAFIGEAEQSLVELLDALETGRSPREIAGIVIAEDGRAFRTPVRHERPDLLSLPWPARDLIPMHKYRERTDDTSVLASRGCPYPCSFCSIRVMSNYTYRRRTPKLFVAEVQYLRQEYGFERLTFFDDIFTINRKYALALCEELRTRQMDIPWSCETRVDRVDMELLRAMHAAGCYQIFYGVESGSQRILDSMAKGTTVPQIRNAVAMTKQAGIQPVLSIMVGVPDDDEASIRETIRMVKDLDAYQVWFQPFSPFPGTEIISQIRDLLDDNWLDLYRKLDLRSPVLRTRYLTLKEVKGLYMEALLSVSDRGWVKPPTPEQPAAVAD
jgi:anaerobic magnesium-protoporphyrin IX monomethyl ester cyclase